MAVGRCDRMDQVWPAASVLALLRAGRRPLTSSPEFAELTGLAAEPLQLADRISTVLEATAAERPVLIALDDVHWADRYQSLRQRGTGHQAALRQLGNRLVGILHGCLKTGSTYDETTAWAHLPSSA